MSFLLSNQSPRRKKAIKKRVKIIVEVPETIEVEQEKTLKERILGGLEWLKIKLKM